MLKNRKGITVRLPRKTKKELNNECGKSEFFTQSNFIREGHLENYIVIK